MKTTLQDDDSEQGFKFANFSFVPPVYVNAKTQGSRFSRCVAVIIESYKNGFGKPVSFRNNSSQRNSELNRGNVPHRVGKIISTEEHDLIVQNSYAGFDEFQKSLKLKKI
jgi:hypothetical protein